MLCIPTEISRDQLIHLFISSQTKAANEGNREEVVLGHLSKVIFVYVVVNHP